MDESIRRVCCSVMYHGAHYNGWQVQVNAKSVQGTIQKALSQMHREEIKIHGSGRTDAGVHAFGQTFHFDTHFKLDEEEWKRALNSSLPSDIQILDVVFVDKSFHARKSALGKRYDYLILLEESNPFTYQTHLSVLDELDYDAIRKVASYLIGAHDFTSLCSNSVEETPNQVRTIHRLEIEEEENQIRYIFEGDGFLRYMIRMLMSVLLDVGKGKLSFEDVIKIIEAKDKRAYSGIVSPVGLYLMEVYY